MIDIEKKIHSLFIFNSNYGPKEGDEHKKILFFYPNDIGSDARKTEVGLCEAVIKFMSTFSSEPCSSLQTQTKKYIFYQPEQDFWMVLVLSSAYATKPSGDGSNDVEPSVMQDVLISAYRMFRMFVGLLKDISPENIYEVCDNFFNPFISSKEVKNELSNVIQGINYLPLEKNSFFKVICFIDLLEINYPDFKCVSFIYNDQLIWNGLCKDDMLTLYQYLVQNLLPKEVEKEIQGGAVTAAQRHGRFISPQDGIRCEEDLQKLPKVFLMREDDEEKKQYYLVIYRTLSATVCFTVYVDTTLDISTFKSLDAFIGPHLSTIASSISEQCTIHALQTAQITNADHKFLYFNRLNLAYKTSPPLNTLTPSSAVKPEVISIIAGMHKDRESLGNYGEIIIKTPDEYWITGKSSNDREFYVVMQKNANLKEIADEVKKICESQMKGIFFYPM
ncbi:vacuolar fusion protein CCZ1 homolog [Leptidea sinapis]|uniref:vacuolar fusion protein CCZ1 homolog n=1 Tax=Leptidea sinapis TaxID=189913 RepID=UPI00213942CD|nr:vacuolar fusion protein CCZ1 homolog [Leptidea sinapis]